MRITVHIQNSISEEIKKAALNEKKSVSSLVAESVEYYIKEKRKKKAGEKVLKLIGKAKISPDVFKELEKGRKDYDRT